MGSRMPYQFNVDVLGTDGGLQDNRFFSRKIPGVTEWAQFPTVLPDSGAVSHHPFAGEIDHFIDCITEDKESHVSVHDAVNTHRGLFAIDKSCAEGGERSPFDMANVPFATENRAASAALLIPFKMEAEHW